MYAEDDKATEECSTRPCCVFAHVGQFVRWKNQFLFLDAAERVAELAPESRFVLVGDDIFGRDCDYKRSLLNTIGHSSIRDKITSVGWQRDMNQLWPTIGCLVHTADCEPFGRVIIEAMCCRILVIAVTACGPSEIIENDGTGILVQPNDVNALASAVLRVAQDREMARRIGTAGYKHVRSKFTQARMRLELVSLYGKILR